MKKYLIGLIVGALITIPVASYAQTASLWKLLNNTLQPVLSSWSIQVPSLGTAGNPCLTVSNTGVFSTQACGGGGGAGTFSTTSPYGTTLVQYPYTSLFTSLDTSATSTSGWWYSPTTKTFNAVYGSTTALTVSGNTYLASLNGVLKGTSGLVGTASNGTDYTLLTADTCGAGYGITALTAAGGSTCGNTFSTTSSAYWASQNSVTSLTTSGSSGAATLTSGVLNIPNYSVGGGSAAGSWATTTSTVSGELNNYSNNSTDIVDVGGSATTTAKFYVDPNIGQAVLNGGGAGTSTISVGSSSHGGCIQTWDAVNAQYDKSWVVGGIMYVDIGTCQ